MKRTTKLKYIGVCAATLLALAPVATPAVGVLAGAGVTVADAATAYKQGYVRVQSFTPDDVDLLNLSSTTAKNAAYPGTLGNSEILKAINPGGTNFSFLRFQNQSTVGFQVRNSLNLVSQNILNAMNKNSSFTVVFEGLDGVGGRTFDDISYTINVKDYEIEVVKENKTLEDKVDLAKDLKIWDLDGTLLEAGVDYTDTDIISVKSPDYSSATGTGFFDQVTPEGRTFDLNIHKINLFSGTVTIDNLDIPVRYTVTATDATKPTFVTKAKANDGITPVRFFDQDTVPDEYAIRLQAISRNPSAKDQKFFADFVLQNITGVAPDFPDANTKFEEFRGGIYVDSVRTNAFAGELIAYNSNTGNVKYDGSAIDYTKEGRYDGKITVTNTQGATSTFFIPVIIGQSHEGPAYVFFNGVTKDQTIKVGEGFDPFSGIRVFDNEAAANQPANAWTPSQLQARTTIQSNVNTSVPGVYTIKYVFTNPSNYTTQLVRTITVIGEGKEEFDVTALADNTIGITKSATGADATVLKTPAGEATGRKLQRATAWKAFNKAVGKTTGNVYYQVAPDQWLSADEFEIVDGTWDIGICAPTEEAWVDKAAGIPVYYTPGGKTTGRILAKGTGWKTFFLARSQATGDVYYQVAPDQWLKATDIRLVR